MTVTVNGIARVVGVAVTVADVVRDLGAPDSGCAVAVNDEVVPRAAWPTTALADGDRVEVLTAVQGG
jgi:sulfur carrier protein